MDEIRERQLAHKFYRFGSDSCRNVRARLVHYQPWTKDALGNESSMGNDTIAQTLSEGAGRNIHVAISASTALTDKYGNIGVRALQAMGVSPRNIGFIQRSVRGMRNATRGLGALTDVYDQMTTLAAFSYSDSLLVSRFRTRLSNTSVREGFEEFADYTGKVEPFFLTIREFLTLTAMSIESMPSEEANMFAIEAAFQFNDIPIPDDLRDLFYDPGPAGGEAAAPDSAAETELDGLFAE